MKVRDVMTHHPACCHPDTTVPEAGRAMVTHDCGSLPVLDREHADRVSGVITNRNITIRAAASGRDPATMRVEEVMSHPLIPVEELCGVDDCGKTLEKNQVRRLPVVEQTGRGVGALGRWGVGALGRLAPLRPNDLMSR